MRIVAGKHRGRRLTVPPGRDIRPTADRTRESLFNILEHGGFGPGGASPIPGARVLDAFCGTGALAFEALSRGAAHATLIDNSPQALIAARANAAALGEAANVRLLRLDATRPGPAPDRFTLAFLDPPYGMDLTEPALTALAAENWLASGAVVVAETGTRETLEIPEAFALLDERRYGTARLSILRYQP